MRTLLSLALFLVAAASSQGASSSFEIEISAGRHERTNVPVQIPLSTGQIGRQPIRSARITRLDGEPIQARWTGPSLTSSAAGEPHFILPQLGAGETMKFKATLSSE